MPASRALSTTVTYGKENSQMTISSMPQWPQAALISPATSATQTKLIEDPSKVTTNHLSSGKKFARALKISLIVSGGAIAALILVAIGLYFATSGQYPVAATVLDLSLIHI